MKYRDIEITVVKIGEAASDRLQELLEKEKDKKPIEVIVNYLGDIMLYTDFSKEQMKRYTHLLVAAAKLKRYKDMARLLSYYFLIDELARRIRNSGHLKGEDVAEYWQTLNDIDLA